MVAFGPGVPLQLDGRAGLDLGVDGTVAAIAVADNVGIAEGVRRDESEVRGGCRPADDVGGAVRVGVLVDEITTVATEY